jgi:hypothetical protein
LSVGGELPGVEARMLTRRFLGRDMADRFGIDVVHFDGVDQVAETR